MIQPGVVQFLDGVDGCLGSGREELVQVVAGRRIYRAVSARHSSRSGIASGSIRVAPAASSVSNVFVTTAFTGAASGFVVVPECGPQNAQPGALNCRRFEMVEVRVRRAVAHGGRPLIVGVVPDQHVQ